MQTHCNAQSDDVKDFKENRNENVKPVKLWSAFTRTWAEGTPEGCLKIGARGDCSHNGTILVPMPCWGTVHSAFYRSQKEKINHVMLNL